MEQLMNDLIRETEELTAELDNGEAQNSTLEQFTSDLNTFLKELNSSSDLSTFDSSGSFEETLQNLED